MAKFIDESGLSHLWDKIKVLHCKESEAVDALTETIAAKDLPCVFLELQGGMPQTKDYKLGRFSYRSLTKNFDCYLKAKAQGASSLNFPKKSCTIKFYKDAECTDSDKKKLREKWGMHKEYVLKADWSDITHSRNIVSARVWGDVVASRSDYDTLPEGLRESANNGATDGFPVKVYCNGIYQGLYVLSVKKDNMVDMDDTDETQCILSSGWNAIFNGDETIDGSIWTDELHDVVPEALAAEWAAINNFVRNSSDEDFKAHLGDYFDVQSLIDFALFIKIVGHYDICGNQIYYKFGADSKWLISAYDMDNTFGALMGTGYLTPDYDGYGQSYLIERLRSLFSDALKARWLELRECALSKANILGHIERYMSVLTTELMAEDYATTTGNGDYVDIPLKVDVNNIQQMRDWLTKRYNYVSNQLADNLYASLSVDSNGDCTVTRTETGFKADLSNDGAPIYSARVFQYGAPLGKYRVSGNLTVNAPSNARTTFALAGKEQQVFIGTQTERYFSIEETFTGEWDALFYFDISCNNYVAGDSFEIKNLLIERI